MILKSKTYLESAGNKITGWRDYTYIIIVEQVANVLFACVPLEIF